jgi:hypothetical protein
VSCTAATRRHLLPIFGVRGANTGWQDAQNLGWKLAAVQQGRAPLALLRSYSAERVAAAREIVAEAGKSTRFMTPPTRGFRLLRDATLSLALSQGFVRPLLHWRTSRPHEYTHSPLNSPNDDSRLFSAGPPPGAVMKSVQLAPDRYLLDAAGGGFTLLLFDDARAGRTAGRGRRRWPGAAWAWPSAACRRPPPTARPGPATACGSGAPPTWCDPTSMCAHAGCTSRPPACSRAAARTRPVKETTMSLPLADLEQVYDELAEAVDRAGDHRERFLAKLALLLADDLGDAQRVTAHIETALRDL